MRLSFVPTTIFVCKCVITVDVSLGFIVFIATFATLISNTLAQYTMSIKSSLASTDKASILFYFVCRLRNAIYTLLRLLIQLSVQGIPIICNFVLLRIVSEYRSCCVSQYFNQFCGFLIQFSFVKLLTFIQLCVFAIRYSINAKCQTLHHCNAALQNKTQEVH